MFRPALLTYAAAVVAISIGCRQGAKDLPDRAPRPVSVLTLEKKLPEDTYTVSGSVKAWKTEDISFEVGGRIEWVLEPGSNVERPIPGADGGFLQEGTALAKIDDARYQVALESAEAQLEVAQLEMEAIRIRLEDSLPVEIESADLELRFAQDEFNRADDLRRNNAISQAAYDEAANLLQVRSARVATLRASEKQAAADLKRALAEIKKAEQAKRDAQRDLDNTTLYASYRGQISDVHVVPGSVVTSGSPVLTLQMMDPVKVEVQVSADKSREFKRRSQVPVSYTLPDNSRRDANAFVYNVDVRAEPATRTFSLTLLLLNEKYQLPLPDGADATDVARAADVWPLHINPIVGAPGDIFLLEQESILQDQQGFFALHVTNCRMGQTMPDIFQVQKKYLNIKDLRIRFLGIWTLYEVEFLNGEDLGVDALVVGNLVFNRGTAADWQGTSVVVDTGDQWVLRPGDLVNVNLTGGAATAGFYVPPGAIYEESGSTSLFVVEDDTVRRIPIDVVLPESLGTGALVKVESDQLAEGMQIVNVGVHFLNDGDRVNAVGPTETTNIRVE